MAYIDDGRVREFDLNPDTDWYSCCDISFGFGSAIESVDHSLSSCLWFSECDWLTRESISTDDAASFMGEFGVVSAVCPYYVTVDGACSMTATSSTRDVEDVGAEVMAVCGDGYYLNGTSGTVGISVDSVALIACDGSSVAVMIV